jgi:hypothetical protein
VTTSSADGISKATRVNSREHPKKGSKASTVASVTGMGNDYADRGSVGPLRSPEEFDRKPKRRVAVSEVPGGKSLGALIHHKKEMKITCASRHDFTWAMKHGRVSGSRDRSCHSRCSSITALRFTEALSIGQRSVSIIEFVQSSPLRGMFFWIMFFLKKTDRDVPCVS